MTDILSLSVSAPSAPIAVGLAGLLDSALTTPPVPAADPFAAFLATAQAMPGAVPAPAQFVPTIVAAKLQPPIVAGDDLPAADLAAEPADGEAEQAADGAQPTIIVDPVMTPALAMLSALVPAQPALSRPVASDPKPQAVIVTRTATKALVETPTARVATKPAVAIATPALTPNIPAAAPPASSPILPGLPTDQAVMTVPVEAPMAARTVVSNDPTGVAPMTVSTPAPIIVAPQRPVMPIETATALPVAGPVMERVIAADIGPPIQAIRGKAEDAETPPDTETETETAAEAIGPAEPRAATPLKPRPIESHIARQKDTEVIATAGRGERARPVSPATRATGDFVRDTGRDDPVIAPPVMAVADPAVAATSSAPSADLLVQRQLVIADDGRWLDSLARDIAHSATGETIRFKLEPVNLGSLTVAIAQGSDGAAIRLTAETHRARDLLVDAQPALVAEARANGLRISETHVDLGSGNRDSNSGNASAGGQPSFAGTANGQQAMRQDGSPRRQPDLPTPNSQSPAPQSTQSRATAGRAAARDSGERFA